MKLEECIKCEHCKGTYGDKYIPCQRPGFTLMIRINENKNGEKSVSCPEK